MYREEEILDLVEILLEAKTIQLRWSQKLFKGDDIINITYKRASYSKRDRERLLKDAPQLEPCISVLGW